MRNTLKILIAGTFLTLTGVEAQAQFFGRPGYGGAPMGMGRPTPMYPSDPNYSMGAVAGRAHRLGVLQQQRGIASDCTDYGQGDCAERMARMGHPNGPGSAIVGGSGYGQQQYYGGHGGGYPMYRQQQYFGGGYGGGYRPMMPVARPMYPQGYGGFGGGGQQVIVIYRTIVVPSRGYGY